MRNLNLKLFTKLAAIAVVAVACSSATVPTRDTRSSPVPYSSTPQSSVALTWAFTQLGQHPDQLMTTGINQATFSVDAALYAFNNPTIAQALVEAEIRCLCVRLISDRTQSGGKSQAVTLETVHNAGVPIKTDAHTGIMHMKVLVIDQRTVFEGSFNATTAASTINDEILVRIDDPLMARAFHDEFETMWNDPRRFHDWIPPSSPVTPVPGTEF